MDEYIRKQNEKNKSAAMGGFEEAGREREAAYKTAEQKSGAGFAELLRQMYADDYRRRAETDASLEARGLNTGVGSQASLEQASTLRQNERDMRLAEESARLNIETSRNAAEAEARAAVKKAIASADYNTANQLYENFKYERSSAQSQVDKLLAAGVMPDDDTISKSGYDLDYVKGLYAKNTASRGGSGKSTFESIAEKVGQTIAAALKNPKGGNGSNKKGGTAATLILNNAMQKKDVNERQEYLLAAQATGAITDKECGGMLLLTMQAPTFAKPKVTALQLGAIEGKEPIDRSEALKLKTAIFGNSPVAPPATVGEAKTMLTNAVVGSLAAEMAARRKQSENMSAYLNTVYDDSAPTTATTLQAQLASGDITQDEIVARHAAAADYREKHYLTSTDRATVEELFMQGYTEEQVDQYLATRSKEQETADNERAMSNVQPHSFLDYDSDVENVIAGILARGSALWNNFLGNISGEGETKNEHEAWLGLHPYDEEAQAEQEAAQQRKKQEYYNFADYRSQQSAAYLDAAKEGKGALGEFAVDAAVVLSDVATDTAANFLVPGSGLVLMGVRAYEQGRMYGRQSGLDDGEQILYGLSTAGIEIATEKLFGGLKIAYGKGVADKAAGKAIAKITERLAETSAGKAVSKFASSGTGKVVAAAFGEGMEEVISDLLQPGVDVAFGLSEEYEAHLEDIVYDGLLGGFVGLLGGGANLAQNRLAQRAAETQTTYNTLAQGGVTAEQQWATMRSQDPSLSGALFSANNGAALMAEFEQAKQGAKSGIAFAFNSIQQTGAVNTNEAAVTAAVTEGNNTAPTVQQAKAESTAQEIAQAAATIQASEAIITQAETARQEIEELHRNGSLSDEAYKKRIQQVEKKIRNAERAANTARLQLNIVDNNAAAMYNNKNDNTVAAQSIGGQSKVAQSTFKKVRVSRQAWSQIQSRRMLKYGSQFDAMPSSDYIFANDRLFVIENYNETSFDIVKRVDPAKDKILADKIVEAFKDGSIETTGDFDRWAKALRNNARRSNGNNVHVGNRGAARSDARLDDRSGRAADGGTIADNSGGANEVGNSVEPDHVQQSDLPQGVGAAESGFTGPMTPIDQWVGEAQERGESYIHDVSNEAQRNLAEKQHRAPYDVPKFDKNGRLTRAGVEAIINSGITDETAAQQLLEEAYEGAFSYNKITDRTALRSAKSAIKKDGYEGSAVKYLEDSYNGKVSKKSQVMGIVLYNNAIANKDYNLAIKLAVALAEDGTNSAQALQARRLLNKLSPEGKLYAVTQVAERATAARRKSVGEKKIGKEADKVEEAVDEVKQEVANKFKKRADEPITELGEDVTEAVEKAVKNRHRAKKSNDEQQVRVAKQGAMQNSEKLVQAQIKNVMRSLNLKMSEVAASSDISKDKVVKEITNELIVRWGISEADTADVAEAVQEQFTDMMADAMERKLKAIYKRKDRKVRSMIDLFVESVNLGAFDSGEYAQKAAERFFGVNVSIDVDLAKQYVEALENGDKTEIDTVYDKLLQSVADQMPASWVEKLNAWRYLAMLFNPVTHVRNSGGNVGFMPVRMAKNFQGALIESAVNRLSKNGIDRTKTVLNLSNQDDRNLLKFARADYANVQDAILSGGKYNDSFSEVNEKRTIYKSEFPILKEAAAALEAARKGNNKLLDLEDSFFSKRAYADSLAQWLKANGYMSGEQSGKRITEDVLDSARAYAIKEAQKATYRDINSFSQFVSSLRARTKSAPLNAVANMVVEGNLAFKKTPANVFVRAAEYSPLGLLKAITWNIAELKAGTRTTAEFIDAIAAGLTGLELAGLGALLAHLELLHGGGDDDEAAGLQGYQDYSLTLGDTNISLSWLAPEVLPMFVGVEAYNMFQHQSEEPVTLDKIESALLGLVDPMLEMSMLDGVNSTLNAVRQNRDENTLAVVAKASLYNLVSQFAPSILGKLESIANDTRETTFIDKTAGLSTTTQRFLGKLGNKILGYDYNQIDYVDAWGRTQETGNAFERLANNLVNPAYVNEIQVEEVEDELQRLADLGESGMIPSTPSMSTKINGEYLTAEQYEKYAKTAGQLKLATVSDLTSNEVYAALPDADKAEAIRKAYTYATGIAKLGIDPEAKVARWIPKARDFGDAAAYILAGYSLSDIEYEEGEQGAKKEAIAKAINAMPLSRSEKSKLFELLYPTYKNDIEWR